MFRPIVWGCLLVLVLANVGWGQEKAKEKPYLVLDAGGHTALVKQVVFSEGGKEVITVSWDQTIRVWDAATGLPLRTLRPPIGKVPFGLHAVALHPQGKLLVVARDAFVPGGGWEPLIYLVRLSDGRIEKVLRGHTGTIQAVAFSPQGNQFASCSYDATVRIWNLETGQGIHVLQGHSKIIHSMAFAPGGDRLATASGDHTVRIWDLATGKSLHVLKGHQAEVGAIAWSRDGKRIATAGNDQAIRLWESNGTLVQTFDKLQGNIYSLRFLAKDREILFTTGDAGNRAACLNLYDTRKVRAEMRPPSPAFATDVDPEERWAVSTTNGDDWGILIWRLNDGKEVSRLVGQGKTPFAAAWSPDGTHIAWGNRNQGWWRATTAPLERTFSLEQLEFGPPPTEKFGGRRLELGSSKLSVAGTNTIQLIRPAQKLTFQQFPEPNDEWVQCGTLVSARHAAIGTVYHLYLFELEGGKQARTFSTQATLSVAASPNGRYLLSAAGDQTLRIWSLDHDDPLVSLFVAGNEWIAWTPEGYYAASPGGENLMGWHVNNGPDQMASFYPAAHFRKSFYRPDVIKLLLRTGSVARALEIANDARGMKTEAAEVTDVLPPKVRLQAPAKDLTVRDVALEVRARASSTGKHPVTAMQLLIDGRPLQGPASLFRVASPKLGDVEASWNIALSPGKHRLAVRAESTVSTALSEEVAVHYVALDPSEQSKRANLYVLVAGISDYPNNLKLKYAATDAQTLAQALQVHSKSLFDRIEVKQLTDKKATQREILKGITWLGKQMTQRDVGVVFLAGHGEMSASGVFYFLPADIDPEDIAATGVPGEQIKTLLSAMPGRVIFLLDACHAGGLEKNKRNTRALTDDLVRDLAADERGIIVMCASTGRQFALESDQHRQGMFTLALVEGLQGKAKQVEGAVYLHHLDAYVTDRVRELSRGQQSPTTARPASIRSFPLSRPTGQDSKIP